MLDGTTPNKQFCIEWDEELLIAVYPAKYDDASFQQYLDLVVVATEKAGPFLGWYIYMPGDGPNAARATHSESHPRIDIGLRRR
jgi:hypothetical protein